MAQFRAVGLRFRRWFEQLNPVQRRGKRRY